APGGLHGVGADVLGDATGLARRDVRLAQGVQQARLAVIDVTHHGHDRGPRLDRVLGLRARLETLSGLDLRLFADRDVLDLPAELAGHNLRRVRVEGAVDVDPGHAELQQLAQHVGRLDAHAAGETLEQHRLLDPHDLLVGRALLGDGRSRSLALAEGADAAMPRTTATHGPATGTRATPGTTGTGGLGVVLHTTRARPVMVHGDARAPLPHVDAALRRLRRRRGAVRSRRPRRSGRGRRGPRGRHRG